MRTKKMIINTIKPSTQLLIGSAALLAIAMVGATTAHADAPQDVGRYQLSLGGGSRTLPSKSIDSLTAETSYALVDFEAGISLLSLPGIGQVEVGASWDSGFVQGSSFRRIDSELSLSSMLAFARLRRDLYPRLSGFGEIGLGVSWGALSLRDRMATSSRTLEDQAQAAVSALSVGIEYRLLTVIPGVTLGLRAKLGYRAASSLAFRATPKSPGSDTLLLPTSSASLGSVNTSGALSNIALVGRF